MEENLVQNWIDTDKNLSNLITEIETEFNSYTEQAKVAFERLSKLYNIPRMPEDIAEDEFEDDDEDDDEADDEADDVIDRRSLFEEHALIKYLADENEDPRGIVLSAAFHLLNDYRVDLFQVAEKEFGQNIPENCKIGITGEGFNGNVIFPQKETKSWFELGCKIMKQIN